MNYTISKFFDSKKHNNALGLRNFACDNSGIIAIKFALMVPVLLLFAGVAIDASALTSQKGDLQNIADIGAIAGAKELSFSDVNEENVDEIVTAVVERFVESQDATFKNARISVDTKVTENPLRVTVTLTSDPITFFDNLFGLEFEDLNVQSSAEVIGKPNVCVLALEDRKTGVSLEHSAHVTGKNCSVFSNSPHSNGIKAKNSATLLADFICSHGGFSGNKTNFSPEPMTDCPGFDDPLASRPAPAIGNSCDATNFVAEDGNYTLDPGTYCGGLTITDEATVNLRPGIYIIKDGALRVDEDAELLGEGVGFYFTGEGAGLTFAEDSEISLEAPTSGLMAGLLMFSDRNQDEDTQFHIMSNNARNLLGTIYLPNGELRVGGDSKIADKSAYTAIVARMMRLYDGPDLILNTNYNQTEVPVPEGIRGAGQPVRLVN